jgi:dTMP kinase
MSGLFITFEGNEGSGKSTQIALLAAHLKGLGFRVRTLREPGGTPIGEEVRHTLKHSPNNEAMTPEAELLLMNATRAQLVREIIRPSLGAGEIVLCDRFYDSTTAYQGYGRQLDLAQVEAIIRFAVGKTHPDLTLLLLVPDSVSHDRRANRPALRDRIEQADDAFFTRVMRGYEAIAEREPERVRRIDAVGDQAQVQERIWSVVSPKIRHLDPKQRPTG